MIKVEKSSQQIQSHGGIFFTHELFKQLGIDEMIDHHLGKRVCLTGYDYSEIISALVYSQHCGATCIEDIHQMRETFSNHPEFKICSPDTVLRSLNELKTENIIYTSEQGIVHEFNRNKKLSELLLQSIIKTKVLSVQEEYTLDYDNTVIECNKYDSKRSYKMSEGYQHGVGSINHIPVYIEGRNGNSNAKYKMCETLKELFELTEKYNLHIKKFRSDSAAYQKEIIELMESKDATFYIRNMASTNLKMHIKSITQWKQIEYNYHPYQIAEMWYAPFGGEKKYRVIVQRKKNSTAQIDAFSESTYDYYAIITNDEIATPEEVFTFYNQRGGASENVIDILKNDFNWNHLPCSFLAQNTVFMILSAISYVLYTWTKNRISKYIKGITSQGRLKQYIFKFINVATKWIRTGGQTILKVFSDRGYEFIPLKI
jgi:hypothetical protein